MLGRSVVLWVVAMVSTASADGLELGLRAGAFGTRAPGDIAEVDHDLGAGLQLDLTTRLTSRLAIGGLVGIEGPASFWIYDFRTMFDDVYEYRYHPLTVGVVARYRPRAGVWVSGWAGVARPLTTRTCFERTHYDPSQDEDMCEVDVGFLDDLRATYAVGAGAGVALWTQDRHSLGLAATLTRTGGDYASLGLSVEYRHR